MSSLKHLKQMLSEGRLMAAVELCKQVVRENPSCIDSRVVLYELSVFSGDWVRCKNQVETIMNLGGDAIHWISHLSNIHASISRDACWRGSKRPVVYCDDNPEDASMCDQLWCAIQQWAVGDSSALEQHVQDYGGLIFGPGELNGQRFGELGMFDSRLPGILEVSDGGEYAWLSLSSVKRIEMQGGAKNLTEVAWIPSRVFFESGEVKDLCIYGLYPGTEKSLLPLEVLGRETGWTETIASIAIGAGAQLLDIDGRAIPLLNIRSILFAKEEESETTETDIAS